ncbi:MAG: cyclase family protein [Planctomycetota bacterium]|jgi:kynurenine formamidase|nr:cyclase family protein [Planctomycetota bacterium]
MKVIDLTYDVTDKMLVWPGNQRPIFEWKTRANSEHVNVTRIDMEAHTGTHVDSPHHFLMDGATLEQLPLSHFCGRARLFRSRSQPAGQEITLKEALDAGFAMEEGGIFVLDTGISAYAERRDYNFLFPVPSFELLDWLIERKIACYMTDATSLDRPADDRTSPRHKRLFSRGIPVVENLRNLDEVPENRDFVICAMPLKLVGREGSPCRAAALLNI